MKIKHKNGKWWDASIEMWTENETCASNYVDSNDVPPFLPEHNSNSSYDIDFDGKVWTHVLDGEVIATLEE